MRLAGTNIKMHDSTTIANPINENNYVDRVKLETVKYKIYFSPSPVSPRAINGVLSSAKAWSNKGIKVYAFRPPISPEIRAIEDEMSGFKEAEFISDFQSAGGKWLPFPKYAETYDGVHLTDDGAQEVADLIIQYVDTDAEN